LTSRASKNGGYSVTDSVGTRPSTHYR
jgi:hypothetical protein